MMTQVSYTLFVAATCFLQPRGFKRTVKEAYRRYGPKMCGELCYHSMDSFIYDVDDLSCRRLNVNDTNKPERYVRDTYAPCLKNATLPKNDRSGTDSKDTSPPSKGHLIPYPTPTLTHVQPEETTTKSRNKDTSLALTPSRQLIPFSAVTLTPVEFLQTTKSDEAKAKLERAALDVSVDDVQYNYNITLHQACEEGNVGAVRYILANKLEDINCRNRYGGTPVMTAAKNENKTVFGFLLNHGCDLSVVDNYNDTVLHIASKYGNTDIVKELINNQNYDIDIRGWNKWTPLMYAVFHGKRGVIDFLVSKGCDLTMVDTLERNLLHVACFGGFVDSVDYSLTKTVVFIERRDNRGMTPLLIAAEMGHRGVVDFLVKKGCNQRAVNKYGRNIIHVASMGGHVDMVRHVIEQNVFSIDSRDSYGQTPLLTAAVYCNAGVVEELIQKGCDVKAVDNQRNNILHIACTCCSVQMVWSVIERNILPIDSRGMQGRTPVMIAVHRGNIGVVELLVRNGCQILSVTDNLKYTLLHLACLGGRVDMVEYIISKNIVKNINSRGFKGKTPVMTATWAGHKKVVDFLRWKGCDMKVLDDDGNNILHVACIGGHVRMVQYVIKQNINAIDSRGAEGKTAVMFAVQQGHRAVVDFLKRKGCNFMAIDSHTNTVLHIACINGNTDMVKYIISTNMVNVDARAYYGRTPVMTAAQMGYVDVVDVLRRKHCNMKTRDDGGYTILHVACIGGNVPTVQYIMRLGIVSWTEKNANGMTAAQVAQSTGHGDVAALFREERRK